MIYQILVNVPSDLDVLDVDGAGDYVLGNDVVGELATRRAEWANVSGPDGGNIMPGTRVHSGRKIVHALIDTNSEDPVAEMTLLIAGYGLDWTLAGFATLYERPQVDEDGNPIPVPDTDPVEYEPDAIEYLMPFDSGLIDFIQDDESGRPTPPIQLHLYHRPGMVLE